MSAKRPRRVALVIGQLTRGGAEGQLAQVAQRLDRRRFEPIVYCLSAESEPVGGDLAAHGVTVRILAGGVLTRLRTLACQLDADRIDVVHAWLFLANAGAGIVHLMKRSRPLVTSARNRKLQGRVNQVANALAFRLSRAIVVNSADVSGYIEQHYWAPRERIRVIYNGVDTERFHPKSATGPGARRVVTVGRLVEQKNHAMFLEAAAVLSDADPDIQFAIIGDGPLLDVLVAQAQRLGIADRVTFMGERPDVDAILRDASLFWLTSRWEGMPNVVLEAMASGVPAIATDVGGARELIRSGEDGFVVASGDADTFVRRSRELLGDAVKRQQFSLAARRHAEEFSTAHMVEAMANLYDEVLP